MSKQCCEDIKDFLQTTEVKNDALVTGHVRVQTTWSALDKALHVLFLLSNARSAMFYWSLATATCRSLGRSSFHAAQAQAEEL